MRKTRMQSQNTLRHLTLLEAVPLWSNSYDATIPLSTYTLITPEAEAFLPNPRTPLLAPHYDPVTTMVHDWVIRAPQQPALCQGDQVWSYERLYTRAQHLARLLVADGVTPGDVVAVSGYRSAGLVASMLAVFMSGGVLLPIDPNLPGARKQLMWQEAKGQYLVEVGNAGLDGILTSPEAAQRRLRVDPNTGTPIGAMTDAAAAVPVLKGDNAAYIFFTSGTTGMPKGVLGNHKGLSHFLTWQRDTFDIRPGDRASQLTALSFDVVLRDIFVALVSGATLCLPEAELSTHAVLAWLEQARISVLHTVPTLMQAWLARTPETATLRQLRWVFLAGEPLPDTLVQHWRATFPQAGELINLYGPTETTLAKCCYRVPDPPTPGIQPVGQALPDTQALVMSRAGHLCGIGEAGEIVLRTPFRTDGYLQEANGDSQAFQVNPFRQDANDMLYHTGDRGRYRPDGSLDILGRMDRQVKIRGIRVEPEEVTAHMLQHPGVRMGVVTVHQSPQDHPALVAYVVEAPGERITLPRLHEHLRQHLPTALLPAACVVMEQLPLPPHGKVDLAALPAPEWNQDQRDTAYVAPQTPLERRLAELWSEVLGLDVERVGTHDDFFALGGHSLLAVQIAARLRETAGIDFPLPLLFETPTIAALASSLEQTPPDDLQNQPAPIRPVPRTEPLPLSFAQERLWFLEQLTPGTAIYTIPAAMHLRGPLRLEALTRAFDRLVQRHETLRTTFPTTQGYPMQAIMPAGQQPLSIFDLSALPES